MNATLVRMPTDRLRGWMLAANAQYRLERIAAGESEAEATAKAAQSLVDTFPAGRLQVGHLLFEVTVDQAPVGVLWIGPRSTSLPQEWWIWDIEIDEVHRGHGYGRDAMKLAESAAKEQGATTLGLNVFGFNRVARSLYESLGYETTAMQMRKPL